jgi:hypothetical protein
VAFSSRTSFASAFIAVVPRQPAQEPRHVHADPPLGVLRQFEQLAEDALVGHLVEEPDGAVAGLLAQVREHTQQRRGLDVSDLRLEDGLEPRARDGLVGDRARAAVWDRTSWPWTVRRATVSAIAAFCERRPSTNAGIVSWLARRTSMSTVSSDAGAPCVTASSERTAEAPMARSWARASVSCESETRCPDCSCRT